MWTKQRTRQGDTLSTLARDYGTTVEKIVAANNICPPSQHSDRYLSQQAQAYMLPMNLPRASLSKLVFERDIQKWVRSVGGDCEPIREGSQMQIGRLLTCSPGHYCRFTSDTAINLPMRRRSAAFAGLGAASMLDLLNQLNALKAEARKAADWVVSEASWMAKDEIVQAWRTNFLSYVDKEVNNAAKTDAKGVPFFISNPNRIKLISDFVASAKDQATFVSGGLFDDAMSTLRSSIADILSATAAFVAETPAAAPAPVPAPAPAKPPAPGTKPRAPGSGARGFRPTNVSLADVRSGAQLARGESGPGVTELQKLLNAKDIRDDRDRRLAVDSLYGPRTEGSVKNAQKRAALPQTGTLDRPTLAAIEADFRMVAAPTVTPQYPVASDSRLAWYVGGAAALIVALVAAKAMRRKAA